MALHHSTPLLESLALSRRAQTSVWLKMEALQPSGSFKLRGVGHACTTHQARGAKGFLSSSGGNAGLAVAHAGRKLGLPVRVVVPQTTSVRALELLRQEGAELIVHGASWQEAHAHAQALQRPDEAFIHPFDDPLLWEGHASLVAEVAQAGFKPDAVVLSVGGGGLFSGVVHGLHQQGWTDVPVLAVETTGAASFNAALQAGCAVSLDAIHSVATSLGAKQVCAEALRWAAQHPVQSHTVSDRQAVQACLNFLEDHRVLVEPACGASLALADLPDRPLAAFGRVLMVVCGGATATTSQLQDWARTLP